MIKYEASQQLFPAFRGRVFRTAAAFRCHTEDQVTKLRETAKALEVLVLLENNICWVCWLGLVFLCSFSGWTDFLDLQDFYDSKWSVSFFFIFRKRIWGPQRRKFKHRVPRPTALNVLTSTAAVELARKLCVWVGKVFWKFLANSHVKYSEIM